LEAEQVPSEAMSNISINDKKRGRRRSLLRRSASESTMLLDKKKTFKALSGVDLNAPVPEEDSPTSFRQLLTQPGTALPITIPEQTPLYRASSVPLSFSGEKAPPTTAKATPSLAVAPSIKEHRGMDVVLASDGRTLSKETGIVGNNRLQVMLTIQKDRFKDLPASEQDKVANDLVKAVCQYWGGRILIDQGSSFTQLNQDQSVAAIKALLSPIDAKLPPLSKAVKSKPLLSAPPVPDFLRNASLDILASNGVQPGDMQSAAVKSLQQRKAKRTLAKGLGSGRTIPESFQN